MAQNIKDLFEQERKRNAPPLSEGHEASFLQKLDKQLPQKNKRRQKWIWLRIAASILFISLLWVAYHNWESSASEAGSPPAIAETLPAGEETPKINSSPEGAKEKPTLTLSDISPDLKKVETYFISSINVEIANLKGTAEEQEMVDAYLKKVKELGEEYDKLNHELNTIGVNDMTITALIENLKIRLQLLQRLKKNLNHSKKENHAKESSANI